MKNEDVPGRTDVLSRKVQHGRSSSTTADQPPVATQFPDHSGLVTLLMTKLM